MGSSNLVFAHVLNIMGWACVLFCFAILGVVGRPAFLFMALSIPLFGLSLRFYSLAALSRRMEPTKSPLQNEVC